MFYTVNVNEYVKVKLTEKGKEILREQYKAKPYSIKNLYGKDYDGVPKQDHEGYSRFQLWDLMKTFGGYIQLGIPAPFEMDILVEIKD